MHLARAVGCQLSFDTINSNARRLEMVVNPAKTQLLCVSGSNYCRTSTFIEADSSRINSQESMTLLGFSFGTHPNVDEHVVLIKRKFNSRAWIPRHIKRAGVPEADICKVYSSMIRSTIEYAAPPYHSVLTTTQSDTLEGLQRRALKSIFGYTTSYKEALERSELPLLSDRRKELFRKF